MSVDEKKSATWLFLELCYSWKKLILIVTGTFTVLAVILSLLMPNKFEGYASVLPSQKSALLNMMGGGVTSTVSNLAEKFGSLVGGSESQIGSGFSYLAILNSREAMGKVIKKFDLIRVYGIKDSSIDAAIKKLSSNTDFALDRFGAVTVKVFDRSPERAAAMANYFVHLLNEINANLSSEDARNLRVVIQARYEKNLSDLSAAEDSMKVFQEKYGVFSLPDQAKASVEVGAELESQMILAQVRLSVLRKQFGNRSPEIMAAEQQIAALKNKMGDLRSGQDLTGNRESGVFLPYKEVPGKAMRYLQLYTDVEIQTKLLEMIYPMYEQTKLEEARETPTVLVLDKAVPPEKKTYPMRALIVISGLVLGFVLSVLFSLFVENGVKHSGSLGPLENRYSELSVRLRKKLNPRCANE